MKNYRRNSFFVGLLMLVAYLVLMGVVTTEPFLVFLGDIISGSAVIGIPLFLLPFIKEEDPLIKNSYMGLKFLEGSLMIVAGIIFLSQITGFDNIRASIYFFHTYVFIVSAFLFYILLYKTSFVPKWFSIWGMIAVVLLTFGNIMNHLSIQLPMPVIAICFSQIMLNEIIMAFYLMFRKKRSASPIPSV